VGPRCECLESKKKALNRPFCDCSLEERGVWTEQAGGAFGVQRVPYNLIGGPEAIGTGSETAVTYSVIKPCSTASSEVFISRKPTRATAGSPLHSHKTLWRCATIHTNLDVWLGYQACNLSHTCVLRCAHFDRRRASSQFVWWLMEPRPRKPSGAGLALFCCCRRTKHICQV
jgi:hypothetical protein